MKHFIDKWEVNNKENIEGLPYIDDGEHKLYYRFTPAISNPIGAPLLIILHGHGVKGATKFCKEDWNTLAPIDHFGYEGKGSWWLGEDGDFFVAKLLQNLIAQFSVKYKCQNNIYFYGSSMGGYGAIYHGIHTNARAIYANVPQVKFYPSRYFEIFHKNMEAIFGTAMPACPENNLIELLTAGRKYPIFFLCENIIEEKNHLVGYLKEHTLSFLQKAYDCQVKCHIEILPQEGHTKNYGLKEVCMKFNQFAKPSKETECTDYIDMLNGYRNFKWISDTGIVYDTKNDKIDVDIFDENKPLYIISGNRKIKQLKSSSNLLNISHIKKCYLKTTMVISEGIEVKIFIQLFSNEMLLESNSYELFSGENRIEIPAFRSSVSSLKILFRFNSLYTNIHKNALIDKIVLCIETLRNTKEIEMSTEKEKALIAGIKHISLDNDLLIRKGEKTYRANISGTNFYFYLNYRPREKLCIALPGAADRKKPFYNFQRFSWSEQMSYSFMSILDPTIQKDNELTIGWFQGKKDNYALEKFIILVKKLLTENNINESNVIFFGSSAGGYVSLKVADSFPSSKIIVINPQIYTYQYSDRVLEELLSYSYEGEAKDSVLAKYRDRLEVQIDLEKRKAPIFYFQNRYDKHHLEKHLKPYLNTLDSNLYKEFNQHEIVKELKKLNILYYNDPNSGHSPPNKEKTLYLIDIVMNNKLKGSKWEF